MTAIPLPDRVEWDDERVALLTLHWNNGVSTESIGKILGCSKQAVIGKAGRLNLGPHPSVRATLRASQTRHERSGHNEADHRASLPPRVEVPAIILSKTQTCQWPTSDEKPYTFCGKPSLERRPYCPEHCTAARGTGTQSERAATKGTEAHA